jgi:hypothetical protein
MVTAKEFKWGTPWKLLTIISLRRRPQPLAIMGLI